MEAVDQPETDRFPDLGETARRASGTRRLPLEMVDGNFHRQVAPFLAMWGRNINAQGWATRATQTSSRWSKE